MNKIAFQTTGLAIKTLSSLLQARITTHGTENIPRAPVIFVANHFTRIETLILPYHVYRVTGAPAWSLADGEFFKGAFGAFLETIGALSTRNPNRDRLMVKTLLTGEAAWIIYPEGRMVKNKKLIEKGRYMISYAGGKHLPHTGAATLALRSEFYRQRLKRLAQSDPAETRRLLDLLQIKSMDSISGQGTVIVPVNLTYYPIRAKENALSELTRRLVGELPERLVEELMTEGAMFLSGVDVDIRFGQPLAINGYLDHPAVRQDMYGEGAIDFDDPIPSRRVMRRASLEVMRDYMAAIYRMTTVNHDHLFASILRLAPFRKIRHDSLKERTYLAATGRLEAMGIHTHDHLAKDQTSLLTDDRFNKYKEFVLLAEEKGIIRRNDAFLVKNRRKFSSALDFHRIRIDNPIEVIANEVEPLTALQRHLRRIAWMPRGWVRRRIYRSIERGALEEYRRDYQAFFKPGESKPEKVGRPLLYRHRSKDVGVLLIHGYMAAPLEVKELAEFLAARKYWVYAPRLRGHGTSPEDLATRSYQDWTRSVERGYALLKSRCKRIVVGGFSTGAGLALDLALRIKSIAGVFAVSPPMRLQDFSSRLVPAVEVWNRMMHRMRLEGARKVFVENHPENPHINYVRNPIAGVGELERLMEHITPRLPELDIPALILQADGDPVVDPKGSRRAYELLGSSDKEYRLFKFERHGILLGEGAPRVHRAIGDFIDRLRL